MAAEEVHPSEQMAEKVALILKEIQVTVTPDKVILNIRGTTGDLTHKEWRVVKSFVDNIISEMRAAARR